MLRPDSEELPAVGTVMVDEARDRIGEFQDELRGRFHLRPIGGGLEWDASPDHVRPATDEERMRARVRHENHRSRNGGL